MVLGGFIFTSVRVWGFLGVFSKGAAEQAVKSCRGHVVFMIWDSVFCQAFVEFVWGFRTVLFVCIISLNSRLCTFLRFPLHIFCLSLAYRIATSCGATSGDVEHSAYEELEAGCQASWHLPA